MIRWSDQIALMGGTFDPPHFGHALAIRGLFEKPGVREVRLLPSGTPPLKPFATPAGHRHAMLKLLLDIPELRPYRERMTIDTTELETQGTSYTIDTLRILEKKLGPHLAMVVGTDQLPTFKQWKEFPQVLDACHWVFLERKGLDSSATQIYLSEWIQKGWIQSTGLQQYKTLKNKRIIELVPTPAPGVSSTQIREALALGKQPTEFLPQSIITYLKSHRLYGNP